MDPKHGSPPSAIRQSASWSMLSHTRSAGREYHGFIMKRFPIRLPISAGAALALIISFAPVAPAQTTGYWQYVTTETYTYQNPNDAYLDKSTGIEGAFTLVTEANDQSHASLGATYW